MEMSPAYAAKTAAGLAEKGYELEEETERWEEPGEPASITRYILRRPEEHIVLEVVEYDNRPTAYYVALESFHGLHSPSFLLDSWKLFSNRIEFKYYALEERSMGLYFVLTFPE